MFRIRYYDEMFHPERFNRGVLGLRIRVLNWIRWKLETHVQKLTVKYLCREAAMSKTKRRSMMEMFKLDVEEEKLRAKTTAPHVEQTVSEIRPKPEAPKSRFESLVSAQVEVPPTPPKPLDDLAARYSQKPRQRRYARGRTNFMVASDDTFEAVPASAKPSPAGAPSDESE